MLLKTCPNCGSQMYEEEPCPECDHDERYEAYSLYCQCAHCSEERERTQGETE